MASFQILFKRTLEEELSGFTIAILSVPKGLLILPEVVNKGYDLFYSLTIVSLMKIYLSCIAFNDCLLLWV